MNSADHDYLATAGSKEEFDRRKAELLTSKKNQIAIAMAVSHRLYDNDVDFDSPLHKNTVLYRGLSSTTDNLLRYYGNMLDTDAMTHQFTGYHDGDADHYVIDKDLTEEFGDKVMTDSESGMFVVEVQADAVDDVKAYLANRYRLLTFEIRDNREDFTFTPTIKELSNWNKVEEYITANKLTHLVEENYKAYTK